MINKAFFFDRDGTLIRDKNYICGFSEVDIFPFSVEALRIAKSKRFMLVGITNQSSVARGICKKEEIEKIHEEIIGYFEIEGVVIEKIYYCPYFKEGIIKEYAIENDCRKPEPGMLIKATEELEISLRDSIMVGDSARDIIAGIKAGCKTALVLTGNGKQALKDLKEKNIKPDIIAENLLEVVRLI